MTGLVLITLLCSFLTCLAFVDKDFLCKELNAADCQRRLYGSKTIYNVARDLLYNKTFNHKFETCKPVMLYFIGRHAIRYPDAEDISEMSRVLPKIRQEILEAHRNNKTEVRAKDIELFRVWKMRMKPQDDNRITVTGMSETKAIAKRLKKIFPPLLSTDKADIEIGVTGKERTHQTADAFLEEIKSCTPTDPGVYDDSSDGDEREDFCESSLDELEKTERSYLYFHDICEELLSHQGVELGKPKLVRDFRQSNLMKQLIKRISDRLGLKNGLDYKLFRSVLRACQFEFAIYGDNPWCAAFSNEELKVLEYLDDLEDYNEDAYGRDINGKQTCPLVGDLVKKIKESMRLGKNSRRKTHLQFTHAGVMKRLYSGLGLFSYFNTNSAIPHDEREWRSSLVSPFSANFVAVLHRCKDKSDNQRKSRAEKSEKKKEKEKEYRYKLLTLVQESPVIVGGCTAELCPVDKFMERYEEMATNCKLEQICRI